MTDSERLIKVITTEGMTAKDFAARIDVGQGTISNIASGRNKPSLEVMQKVLQKFPRVNPSWLILGQGEMYLGGDAAGEAYSGGAAGQTYSGGAAGGELFGSSENNEPLPAVGQGFVESAPAPQPIIQKVIERVEVTKTIEKIVIFYSDGTFEER